MAHFPDKVKYNKIQDWKRSSEYSDLCQRLDLEADDILCHCLEYLKCPSNKQIFRTEFGSRSDLHRGFYCPSPVYDIFVGNVKRGRLLKRLSRQTKNYYTYSFDSSGRLVSAENHINGNTVQEHIFYIDSDTYGIILDQWNHIFQLAREVYADGQLVSYIRALFAYCDGSYNLLSLTKEHYTYTSEDLYQCVFTQYSPSAKLCQQTLYEFLHENGVISGYTASDIIGGASYEKVGTPQKYEVHTVRKV